MTPQPIEGLSDELAELILEHVLAWDGKYPLVHWPTKLAVALRDPAVFDTYVTTHALVHGACPELFDTRPPVSPNETEE